MAKNNKSATSNEPPLFPPVVAVVGHVDHGKTTLLDTIRKTSIAAREHGGITQKIGASSIEIVHEGKKRRITFIDTPGHEAFNLMRGRGTQAADIGILVVSSVDGVMPQTKESIGLLLEAKIPFIVALTKADLDTKNPEKVKQQLLRENIMLEGYGGDIPYIEVSAREGKNIKELLDLILLVQELNPAPDTINPTQPLQAIIIESKLDPKSGPKATIVIKNGSVGIKDGIMAGDFVGRVRMLLTDQGKQIHHATIGDAVEILGFEKTPPVGSIVSQKGALPAATPQVALAKKEDNLPALPPQNALDPLHVLSEAEKPPALSLILCTDTLGSLEAIVNAIPQEIAVLEKKTGDVTESDILLAKSTGAIVLSFNSKLRNDIVQLARQELVLLKNYTIIYELIDEIKDVLEGKQLALEEKLLGKAKVLASFPYEKTQALGITVLEGRVAKGDRIRIMRGEESIGESMIASLRMGKNPTSRAEKGQEAGIIINPLLDFTIGDMIVCHR